MIDSGFFFATVVENKTFVDDLTDLSFSLNVEDRQTDK